MQRRRFATGSGGPPFLLRHHADPQDRVTSLLRPLVGYTWPSRSRDDHTHGRHPMTKITLFLATLSALCLHVASAQAGLVRTCVSLAKGSDANSSTSCHCTTPCRTFATAAANTLAEGEITVLDPGDYGGLTITKSISINNDSGGEASITVSGGTTGIIVNAPNGAGYVNLRGLTIQGVGFGGGTGLVFNTGFALTMENCVVRNHTGNGIQFLPNASS